MSPPIDHLDELNTRDVLENCQDNSSVNTRKCSHL